jgi:hypothetical protein
MSAMRAPIAVAFTGIVLCSGLWAATSLIGLAWIAAAALLLWLACYDIPFVAGDRAGTNRCAATTRAGRTGLWLIAAILSAVPFAYLARTWNQEFPFLGDHNVHLRFALQSAAFWRVWLVPVLAGMAIMVFFRGRVLVCAIVLAAAIAAGAFVPPPTFAVRYPGLLHVLAGPMALMPWDHPLNALRLTNALAITGWLSLLRPLLIRRPLDAPVLAVAALLVLQKDILYYLTSAYLEPWMLVLTLVAIEVLVRDGAEGSWRAVLILGAAAMVKEQAVFLIPFAALPGLVSRPTRAPQSSADPVPSPRGGGERVRVRGGSRENPDFPLPTRQLCARTLAAGAAALLPFALYYLARRRAHVWRGVGFAAPVDAFTSARLTAFADRLWQQFGIALPLLAILAAALLVLAVRRGLVYWALAGALLFQIAFFFLDSTAFAWVGYPRFLLLPVALLAASLFLAPPRIALAATVVIFGLNVPGLAALWSESRGSDVHRNFFEHADAPVFFPVEELLRGTNPKQVTVLSNIHGVVSGYGLASLPLAYPKLLPDAQWRILPLDARTLGKCRCSSRDSATLGLFVFFNDRAGPQIPRQAMQRVAHDCLAGLRQTCAIVRVSEEEGQLVGALGYR